jgi:hypothetical protein
VQNRRNQRPPVMVGAGLRLALFPPSRHLFSSSGSEDIMKGIRYLVLLRGINVGGKNIIKMAELRTCFEKMGYADVATYIQSGNVLMSSSERNNNALVDEIEETLSKRFNYESRVVIVSLNELEKIMKLAPRGFGKNADNYRYDVAFLKRPLTAREAFQDLPNAGLPADDHPQLEYDDPTPCSPAKARSLVPIEAFRSDPEALELSALHLRADRRLLEYSGTLQAELPWLGSKVGREVDISWELTTIVCSSRPSAASWHKAEPTAFVHQPHNLLDILTVVSTPASESRNGNGHTSK